MLPLEGQGPLGPLLPHDPIELYVGIALFLIILAVMFAKIVPAFEKTYAARAAAITGGMEKAESAQAQAQAALAEYQAKLATANDEAASIRENAKTQGSQILAEMRAQANAESERIVSQANAQVEAQRAQASQQLKSEIGGLATGLAGKIVGESLDDDERARRTVDRFLAELEQGGSVLTPTEAGQH